MITQYQCSVLPLGIFNAFPICSCKPEHRGISERRLMGRDKKTPTVTVKLHSKGKQETDANSQL